MLAAGVCASTQAISADKKSASVSQDKDRPNIVFILADDMGYGELSCYSSATRVPTPHIDALAETGVRMMQAYAMPVSSPTRSCFLTGKFPQRSGVYGNPDGAFPGVGMMRHCFAKDLQKEGYQTVWMGKWHQGWDVTNHPANNGFEVTYGFLGGMHDYFDSSEGDHHIGGPFAKNCYVLDGFRPVTEMKYLTEELTDRAVNFIANRDQKRPFFMYMAYNAPHTPLQAPDELILKYLKKGYDAPNATRCAMMDDFDAQVGRLIDFLDKNNLRENTLIVFMSDNGPEEEFMSGGLRGVKMTVWEGGVRVPMIASMPGTIPQGKTGEAICSVTDMAATFIGLARGDNNYRYGDGVNLMPYYQLKKKSNAHDHLIFSIHLSGKPYTAPKPELMELFGVRSGDWKLVVDRKRKVDALYNLKEDLAERNDLSASHPEKKAELMKIGRDFLKECPPACGRIRTWNTRINGDSLKMHTLMEHCESLKVQAGLK